MTDEHYCGITAIREASHGKNQIAHVAVKERMGLTLFGRENIFEEFLPM